MLGQWLESYHCQLLSGYLKMFDNDTYILKCSLLNSKHRSNVFINVGNQREWQMVGSDMNHNRFWETIRSGGKLKRKLGKNQNKHAWESDQRES